MGNIRRGGIMFHVSCAMLHGVSGDLSLINEREEARIYAYN
jgi:hypothetical protein